MEKAKLVLSMIFVLSLALCLTNCEPETETITEIDTLYVPVVDSFYVDIYIADEGENTTAIGDMLTVIATIRSDEDLSDVKKFWHVDGGLLNATEGDTVIWTAPEDEGTYTITVHASNNEMATASSINLGAGAYVAVADTYFVGIASCSGCHSGTNTAWEGTGHAVAWESLQNSGHPASYCNKWKIANHQHVLACFRFSK